MTFSWHDFLFQTVFPTIGVFTGTFMCFAPFRSVLHASRRGTLGDINPTPWVFMLGNCAGWLAYAFLLENVYVFLPNACGFVIALWLNIQAIKLQYENHRSQEMHTAIVDALEELDRSKKKTMTNGVVTSGKSSPLTLEKVEAIVEQVIIEDTPPVAIIDPITTAPVEESNAEDDGCNTVEWVSSNSCGYGSIPNETSSGSHDGDVEQFLDEDENMGDFTPLGSEKRHSFLGEGTAAEAFFDYANFIWDVTAQKTPAPASHELMVVAISTFWLFIVTLVVFAAGILDFQTRCLLVGVTVNLNLIFFYGAPLSKIAEVVQTRSSKLIHRPTMLASLMNGLLWFVYGIAVEDVFIAVPNGFGAALGIVQFGLCLVFPQHERNISSSSMVSVASSATLSLPHESAPLI